MSSPVTPDKEESYASTFVGTPCYCAPEVLKQEEYGTPADIWGLGCILIELATLKRPFGDCIGLLAICNRIAKAGSPYLPLFESPRREYTSTDKVTRTKGTVRTNPKRILAGNCRFDKLLLESGSNLQNDGAGTAQEKNLQDC